MSKNTSITCSGVLLAVIAMMMMCLPAQAQSAPPPTSKSSVADQLEVAVGYRGAWAGAVTDTSNFWLSGGDAEGAFRVYKGVSFAGNFTALNTRNMGQGVGLSLYTYTFGPRFTYVVPPHRPGDVHRVEIFGETLLGRAHGFHSIFPTPTQAVTTAKSIAYDFNGGIDVRLNENFSLRAVQLGWERTEFPNTLHNSQNNLTAGIGIVIHTKNH